jgi:hypothetical protein
MKRKDYEKPTMDIVKLQHQTHLLQESKSVQAARNGYGEAQEEEWN